MDAQGPGRRKLADPRRRAKPLISSIPSSSAKGRNRQRSARKISALRSSAARARHSLKRNHPYP